jgi:GTP-binding protein
LKERTCLKGLVIVMDIRHPLKEVDQHVLAWAVDSDVSVHVLLTKADKLSHGAAKKTLKEVEEALKEFGGEISVQIFSSLEQKGVDEAKAVLNKWYEANDE